jgi:putative ABC transport system permease protein
MNIVESTKLAVSAIIANKLRSFLTLLGIIFGVATVIVVVSLVEGFNSYIDEKIADIGTNAFRVQRYSIEDFSSISRFSEAQKRNKKITEEDMQALRNSKGAIQAVGGKIFTGADIKYANVELTGVAMVGASPNILEIDRVKVGQGRYFTESEDTNNRAVCFLGTDVADKLFEKGGSPIGKFIKIDSRPFRVIGIAESLGSVFGESRDKFVAVPLATFRNIYGTDRSITLSVSSTSPETYLEAIEQTRAIMRGRRHLHAWEKDNFGITTPSAINGLRDKIFGSAQTAAIGVTSISLIVGAIVIMNIMLVSVTERTREIGIRKSLGARRLDIMKQFLAESTLLALFGGAIGVFIAYLLSTLVSTLTPIPTSLPLGAILMALGVSGSIGIVSGVYPAWRASRLDPIVALRAE